MTSQYKDLNSGESLFVAGVGVKQHMPPGGHRRHHHPGAPYMTPEDRTGSSRLREISQQVVLSDIRTEPCCQVGKNPFPIVH